MNSKKGILLAQAIIMRFSIPMVIHTAVWRVDYRLCEDFDEAETDDDFAFRHDLEHW